MLHPVSIDFVSIWTVWNFPFCLYAEKSGYGHEKGQPEGADHDDCIPRDSFHYSFRFGVFDLRYGCELGLFLYHVEFRMVLDEQNLSHPYNYTGEDSKHMLFVKMIDSLVIVKNFFRASIFQLKIQHYKLSCIQLR